METKSPSSMAFSDILPPFGEFNPEVPPELLEAGSEHYRINCSKLVGPRLTHMQRYVNHGLNLENAEMAPS